VTPRLAIAFALAALAALAFTGAALRGAALGPEERAAAVFVGSVLLAACSLALRGEGDQ
jgi:hypothetical protein